MCDKMTADQKFIRRRDAAISFLQRLLDEEELSDQQAIRATADNFSLHANIRDDYRIYKALWNLIGD